MTAHVLGGREVASNVFLGLADDDVDFGKEEESERDESTERHRQTHGDHLQKNNRTQS